MLRAVYNSLRAVAAKLMRSFVTLMAIKKAESRKLKAESRKRKADVEAAIRRRLEIAEAKLADIHRRRLEIVRGLTEKIEQRRLGEARDEISNT